MPKVLLYITSRIIWTFIFFGTDSNENRAHVHVGKKGTTEMCKIWLEPDVAVEKAGSLTQKQVNEILAITIKYRKELMNQWNLFQKGQKISIIKIKK